MKLLLTSQGFTNRGIVAALESMLDKPIDESSIAVIPTASLYSNENKKWWIDVMSNVRSVGFDYIDIVDVSAHKIDNWLPRLERVDVLFFTGDNTMHLMNWIQQSGLAERMTGLLDTRILVGNSAGNAVFGPDLKASSESKKREYEQKHSWQEPEKALGLYDFYVTSHFNNPKHKKTKQDVTKLALTLNKTLYAIDDQSALVVVDGVVQSVVGDGEHVIFESR